MATEQNPKLLLPGILIVALSTIVFTLVSNNQTDEPNLAVQHVQEMQQGHMADSMGSQSMSGEEQSERPDQSSETSETQQTAYTPSADHGHELYMQKGCIGCHSVDGSSGVGPSFQGLYGHTVTLTDGSSVVADDAYLTESIRDPSAKIVEGFAPAMPAFRESSVSERDVQDIIEYIKSLSE